MSVSISPRPGFENFGWRADLPAAVAWQRVSEGRVARISEQHRSGYRVCDGEREFSVQSPAPWTRAGFPPEQRAVVGDFVRLAVDEDLIIEILPRSSLIKRGAAGEHLKVQPIATNIDTVLVVTGLDHDFNVRRLERYLVLVHASGASPVLVLTKADRCEDISSLRERLSGLESGGVPVVAVNAKDADSVSALAPWLLPGHSLVLVGSSGAGKSTLTNTLMGREQMKTGEVRERDSRGRHTTTHRALLPLPTGACLIDTPGMRELKLTGDEDVADQVFDDIEAITAHCRFRDCHHEAEPGCAIRKALEEGGIDPGRFANYRKLMQERDSAAQVMASRQAKSRAPSHTKARRSR